jgi:hypothetical protein
MWTSFSGMAGGGVFGRVVGIVHIIMTGVGFIMTESQAFILMYTRAGENSTDTITGTDARGTTKEFLTGDFTRTGRAGMMIDTGKGEGPGASRDTGLDRSPRDRN